MTTTTGAGREIGPIEDLHDSGATEQCPCGKPRTHLDAGPDSQEWACRVPEPSMSTAPDEGDLLDLPQAAAVLGFDVDLLAHWQRIGAGPHAVLVDGRLRYRRSDLAAFEVAHAAARGPVECAPWCERGDGHPGVLFAADQWCSSAPVEVPLSAEQPTGEFDAAPQLQVYAHRKAAPGGRVSVDIARGDESLAVPLADLTPGEAAQLVEALRLVLGQIGADR